MIPRYTRPEMAAIWSEEAKFRIWLEVELAVLKAMCARGDVPKEAYLEVSKKADFDLQRIAEIEEEVKHDVIAFLSAVSEKAGPSSRYLHRGMTSSDLLDTSLALQLWRSAELILKGIESLSAEIRSRAEEHCYTPCIGRSHGIHAEPTTFGLKLLSWYAELKRHKLRVAAAAEEIRVGKIAGAVGTYAGISPEIEVQVLGALGLRAESVPSQVVHRDRHAAFFSALALLASSIERFAVEVRHLQRTEVREVLEPFSPRQKGSSAMPHKKNPILSENLCGLARLVRSYGTAAFENIPLWHERDISHSSAERIIAPDACLLVDFMLHRFRGVVKGMVVDTDQMRANLELTRGLIFSGALLTALTDGGMQRNEAYRLVQRHAMATWESKFSGEGFEARVRKDTAVTDLLSSAILNEVFDLDRHYRHVEEIFRRTFGE